MSRRSPCEARGRHPTHTHTLSPKGPHYPPPLPPRNGPSSRSLPPQLLTGPCVSPQHSQGQPTGPPRITTTLSSPDSPASTRLPRQPRPTEQSRPASLAGSLKQQLKHTVVPLGSGTPRMTRVPERPSPKALPSRQGHVCTHAHTHAHTRN